MQAPVPSNEHARLRTLRRYAVLDTEAEPSFDRITALAARVLRVPICLVSLVDADRQWFKSCVGLGVRETGRDISFCAHAILSDDVLVVPDATEDARFLANPVVLGAPFIRAYAGAPLTTSDGFRIGTLCAIDTRPRAFDADERATLADLARLVVDELELRLAVRERRLFERVLQTSPNVVYVYDPATRRTLWSSRLVTAVLGYDPRELGDHHLGDLVHPEDGPAMARHFEAIERSTGGQHHELAYRVRAADGTYRWFLSRETPFEHDATGRVTQMLGLATDVTALKDAEDRALRSEQAVAERVRVLEAILESAGEGIMVADEHARLIIANPVGRRIVGRGPSDVPLQDGIMWAHETGLFRDETEAVFPLDELPLRRALRGETLDGVDMFVKNPRYPDGIYVQATGRPVREPDGRLRGGVVMLTDVTALKRARQRIAELADTDELTGLPNRRALRQRLELAAAEAARGRTFAVAIADVDHFKRVNDTHGHPTGDRVLVEVARALAQAVRRGDLVARLGGEEFCIVQADVTPSQGEALVERLRAAVAQIATPVAVTASFGVCHSSTTAVPDEMLAAADAALYRAKAAGRNRVVLAGAGGAGGAAT